MDNAHDLPELIELFRKGTKHLSKMVSRKVLHRRWLRRWGRVDARPLLWREQRAAHAQLRTIKYLIAL